MFARQENNQPVSSVAIQNRSGDIQYDANVDSILYKLNGALYNYTDSAPIALTDLDVAFAATTPYFAGDMIVEAGNIYIAKFDFTSTTTFDAKDWYFVKSNTLANGYVRAYGFFIRYDVETETHTFSISCTKTDVLDTASVDVNTLNFDYAALDFPRESVEKRSHLGTVVMRNRTGADFIPGTDSLTTANLFTYIISNSDTISS